MMGMGMNMTVSESVSMNNGRRGGGMAVSETVTMGGGVGMRGGMAVSETVTMNNGRCGGGASMSMSVGTGGMGMGVSETVTVRQQPAVVPVRQSRVVTQPARVVQKTVAKQQDIVFDLECVAQKYSIGRLGFVQNWQTREFKVHGPTLYYGCTVPVTCGLQGKRIVLTPTSKIHDCVDQTMHRQATCPEVDMIVEFPEGGVTRKLLIRFGNPETKATWAAHLKQVIANGCVPVALPAPIMETVDVTIPAQSRVVTETVGVAAAPAASVTVSESVSMGGCGGGMAVSETVTMGSGGTGMGVGMTVSETVMM